MSNDNNVDIHIRGTTDGSLATASRKSVADLEEMRKATNALRIANAASSEAAKDYIKTLERKAATLGMTATQARVYEAATKGASLADQEAVRGLSDKIEAHGKSEQAMLMAARAGKVLGAAIGVALVKGLKDSVLAAQEAEQAMLKLDAVYKASGGASGMTRGELDGMAESMKGRTGFDDDKIRGSMALLLTFRNIGRESFGAVMSVAADLSRVIGQDLDSSVMMLGKALENPEHGLTALIRAGVSFSDAQKQTIKDMVAMGRQAEAMTLLLNTLREQGINGAAEAMNTGLFKATNDLSQAWGDLLKTIGGTAIVKGTVETVFGSLSGYLDDMRRIVNDGDWLDRLAFFTVGLTTPSMLKENQWQGSVGGKEAREAREADEKQKQQRLADQRSSFLREFETPEQKRDRELNNAAHLFSGSPKLQEALDAVQKKYASSRKAAPKDDMPGLMNKLSGLDSNFNKELETLHKGYGAGRIDLDAYRESVEKLILKQPFVTKDVQETIRALADKERVLNKVDAAETAAADVVEKARDANAQRVDALRLEIDMMGKNAAERARLTEFRKIDLQLARDIEKVTEKLGKIGDTDGIDAAVQKLTEGAEKTKTAWVDAYGAIETRERDWIAGAKDGLQSYAAAASKTASNMANSFKRGAQMAEDALANFVATGKLDIASLARYAAVELARENFAKPVVKAGSSWLKDILGLGGGGDPIYSMGSVTGTGGWDYASMGYGFAAGGDHRGGYRIVGEEGPELEATGPSRIFNADQTRDILSGGGSGGGTSSVRIEVVNPPGRPAEVESATPSFDAEGMVVTIVMRDIADGGPIARTMQQQYGINRAAGVVR